MGTAVFIFVVVILVCAVISMLMQHSAGEKLTPAQRRAKQRAEWHERRDDNWQDGMLHGARNPALICPHCQTKGKTRTKLVKNKKGISGAKATGAILTGGASMLATGLSRKEAQTEAHCDNCSSTWTF